MPIFLLFTVTGVVVVKLYRSPQRKISILFQQADQVASLVGMFWGVFLSSNVICYTDILARSRPVSQDRTFTGDGGSRWRTVKISGSTINIFQHMYMKAFPVFTLRHFLFAGSQQAHTDLHPARLASADPILWGNTLSRPTVIPLSRHTATSVSPPACVCLDGLTSVSRLCEYAKSCRCRLWIRGV